jgi:adenylate kinase family enzyme
MWQRILSRATKEEQLTGKKRSDDNEISFKKRMVTFKNETIQVLNHYENLKQLERVDGNREESQIFEDIKKIVERRL